MRAKKNRTGLFSKKTMSAVLGRHGIIFDTHSLEELNSAIDEVLSRNVRILCINGGDGSLQKAVTRLLNKTEGKGELPFLIPMRGGTMNMVCKNVGITGNPYVVLERLVEKYKKFKTGYDGLEFREFRVIKVRSNLIDGIEYTFCFANGIAFKVIKTYYEGGNPSPQRAFNLVTSIIGGFILGTEEANYYFEHFPAKILVEDKPYPYDQIILSVASSYPKLVLWFTPFFESTRVKEHEGFNFFTISADNWEIIKNLRSLSRGLIRVEESYNDVANNVKMEFQGGFTLDGEVYEGKGRIWVELSAGPVLKFIRA
jgi:hypothetical protein